ncbi:hypothetical protein CR513_22265, partial [Mucuna pruriens]
MNINHSQLVIESSIIIFIHNLSHISCFMARNFASALDCSTTFGFLLLHITRFPPINIQNLKFVHVQHLLNYYENKGGYDWGTLVPIVGLADLAQKRLKPKARLAGSGGGKYVLTALGIPTEGSHINLVGRNISKFPIPGPLVGCARHLSLGLTMPNSFSPTMVVGLCHYGNLKTYLSIVSSRSSTQTSIVILILLHVFTISSWSPLRQVKTHHNKEWYITHVLKSK